MTWLAEVAELKRSRGLRWVAAERAYSQAKWTPEKQDALTRDGLDEWERWLGQYLGRARTLGLDTAVGRQALAKYAVVAVAMVESVERVHGPLPEPGRPSGEVS